MTAHGYYKISRKAHEPRERGGDPFWNEPRVFSRWEAWTDLIAMAAYAPHRAMIDGTMVALQRGELVASQRYLSQRWSWSKSRVFRFLARLEEEGRLERRNGASLWNTYLLVNYGTYQGERTEREQATEQGVNRKPKQLKLDSIETCGEPRTARETATEQRADQRRRKVHIQEEPPLSPPPAAPAPEGSNGHHAGNGRQPATIPDPLLAAIPDFADRWQERMKTAGRKKPNPSAEVKQLELLVRTLAADGREAVLEAVEAATVGGYTGMFPKPGRARPARAHGWHPNPAEDFE